MGIRGSWRRRILAETADQLRESEDAGRFGEPKLLATRFADELATHGARRIAFTAFLVLAPAGIAYAVLFGLIRTWPDIASARLLPLAIGAALTMVLAPQVALAAGLLTAAQAWRLRLATSAPAAEIVMLRRRTAVALGSGAAAFAAIGLYAYEYSSGLLDSIPLRLRGRRWRFCLLVAATVAAAGLFAGGLDEGPRSGVGQFVAICAGFAVFGRWLGLR